MLKLDKPIYVGASILDIAKTLMYDLHYNYIKTRDGDKARLLFTDTDSLMYEIETEDVYEDLWEDKELFDNNDYPKSSRFYYGDNKKVVGKMKDETSGVPITDFVALRSKMYSYTTVDGSEEKKAKRVERVRSQEGYKIRRIPKRIG